MLPDLSLLLNYKHEKVIKSYIENYHVEEAKALDLFIDMLKYLWITRKHMLERKQYPEKKELMFELVMQEEMRDMDNMWHNFILYTHDYTQFCLKYFGVYIHHLPNIAETMTQTDYEFSADMEKYLSYIYDNLGEETVRRWFSMHLSN